MLTDGKGNGNILTFNRDTNQMDNDPLSMVRISQIDGSNNKML